MTTYLSWRVGFALEVVIIAVVLTQIRLVKDVAFTGSREVDVVGAVLSVFGMGGLVLGILVWQEGGEFVVLLMVGAIALFSLARWLVRRKRESQVTLLDPDLFRKPNFTAGISGAMLQQVTLGGAMIVLPLFLQMTLEYDAMQAGLVSLAPLSLTMFATAVVAEGRPGTMAGGHRSHGVLARGRRDGAHHPDRPAGRQWLVPRSCRCSSPAAAWACWSPS